MFVKNNLKWLIDYQDRWQYIFCWLIDHLTNCFSPENSELILIGQEYKHEGDPTW